MRSRRHDAPAHSRLCSCEPLQSESARARLLSRVPSGAEETPPRAVRRSTCACGYASPRALAQPPSGARPSLAMLRRGVACGWLRWGGRGSARPPQSTPATAACNLSPEQRGARCGRPPRRAFAQHFADCNPAPDQQAHLRICFALGAPPQRARAVCVSDAPMPGAMWTLRRQRAPAPAPSSARCGRGVRGHRRDADAGRCKARASREQLALTHAKING